ncbi:MAG: PAS domain-containing sensor histidine kinase [Woeseia sp.]
MMKVLAELSTDLSNRTNVLILLGCGLLAAGIFVIDIASLPLGVAAGVAYVAVVLLSLWLPRWQYAIVIAAGVSILTILGFLWSEPAGIPWMVVANRLLALAAIWLTAIVGSWLVYTRRKKSEDALRMQKSFSDTLFKTAPAVVLLLDPNGRITGINPYLERVSGYSAKEVLDKYWYEAFTPEDERPDHPDFLHDASEDSLDTRATKVIVTKDGEQREIEWHGTTLSDAEGKVVGYLNVGHDVTERIQRESALQRAEQEAIRARNAKTRFLETASNDFRHHLQTLNLLNGALRKVVKEPKAHSMFALQGDALAHLSDLLNSLLELSTLESGDVELKITDTPVEEIFKRLRDEFESQAKTKGLELRFDSQSEIASSDRMLLTRIVRILISNAIRYTNKGFVNVGCRREAGSLRITVEDSGIGIEPDQLAGIFDEFYRVDKDPAGRSGCLGLGLSIVERSANLLGSNVEVESEVGRGSSFSIVVPVGSAIATRSVRPAEDVPEPRGG